MVVCVAPNASFFFRVNSNPFPVAVKLSRSQNSFLKWDSYLECNGPLEFDDYVIQESLAKHGVIGKVSASAIVAIWDAIRNNGRISPANKKIIATELGVVDKS